MPESLGSAAVAGGGGAADVDASGAAVAMARARAGTSAELTSREPRDAPGNSKVTTHRDRRARVAARRAEEHRVCRKM
jgi:hypothetical protein